MEQRHYELHPLETGYIDLLHVWRNDASVRGAMINDREISLDEHRRYFGDVFDKPEFRYLVFFVDGEPNGVVYFSNIDWKRKRSHWGFYLNPARYGRGWGSAMCFLGLEYGFESLGLEIVDAEVFDWNKASIRVHESLGFRKTEQNRTIERNGMSETLLAYECRRSFWRGEKAAVRGKLL